MRISNLSIRNFRGIQEANFNLTDSQVFLGDNNTGKTTVLEALNLALGPDRLNRFPPIDEHDFFQGHYLPLENKPPIGKQIAEGDFTNRNKLFSKENTNTIAILVELIDLNDEHKSVFGGRCEFYSVEQQKFWGDDELEFVDDEDVTECVRIVFIGHYDAETDDFVGKSYYFKDLQSDQANEVRKKQKHLIGFLYLRSLRTGSRALSLEKGSLLDIALRAREIKPKMWEDVLTRLEQATIPIDKNDDIASVLDDVQTAINHYVPKEWGSAPILKVSKMTREDLRNTIVAFIETSEEHSAPYYRQGSGTSNMLVLALLSIIRDSKQNVIFAMEEPETSIPPHVQKQVVSEVMSNSDQTVFTSHSPYVIEEFSLTQIAVLANDGNGRITSHNISISDPSRYDYQKFFRTQLCEGLLARRVIVCEGVTEISVLSGVSRQLAKSNPDEYGDLAALGYCMIDSQTESQIQNHASALSGLGKHVSVFCDAQDASIKASLEKIADEAFIHKYRRIETLIINNLGSTVKERIAKDFDWPKFVLDTVPEPQNDIESALKRYLNKTKGKGGAVTILSHCSEMEVPKFLRDLIKTLTKLARQTEPKIDLESAAMAKDEI